MIVLLCLVTATAMAALAVAVGMRSLMRDMADRIGTQEVKMDRLLDVLDRYFGRLEEVTR